MTISATTISGNGMIVSKGVKMLEGTIDSISSFQDGVASSPPKPATPGNWAFRMSAMRNAASIAKRTMMTDVMIVFTCSRLPAEFRAEMM